MLLTKTPLPLMASKGSGSLFTEELARQIAATSNNAQMGTLAQSSYKQAAFLPSAYEGAASCAGGGGAAGQKKSKKRASGDNRPSSNSPQRPIK